MSAQEDVTYGYSYTFATDTTDILAQISCNFPGDLNVVLALAGLLGVMSKKVNPLSYVTLGLAAAGLVGKWVLKKCE